MLLEVFPSGPFETNAYLIGCLQKNVGIFIDPAPGSEEKLIQAADKKNLKIEAIFLTHSHWDHIGDVAVLKKDLGLPVYVHKADQKNLREPGADKIPLMMTIEGAIPDHDLKDQEELEIGELRCQVLHTPGHSPGGVCFYFYQEKVLISGDTLFKESIGNLSFPTSDPEAMWVSLKRLAQLPPDVKVYPGHGPSTTIGAEKWLDRAEELFS